MSTSAKTLLLRWFKTLLTGIVTGSLFLGLLGLLFAGWQGLGNGLLLGALIGVVAAIPLAAFNTELTLLSGYGRRAARKNLADKPLDPWDR